MAVKGAKGKAKAKAKKAKEELYRQLILDAAQGVFADNGYDDAKIGQIAEASGVSLQTLYAVFPGKAAIYQAICDPLPAIPAGLRATTLYFLEQPNFLKLRPHGGFTWGAEPAAAGSRGRTEAWRAALERLRGACQLLTTQSSLDNPKPNERN